MENIRMKAQNVPPWYAIHLSDLSEATPQVIDVFLRPDFLPSNPFIINVGQNIDDVAVLLEGAGALNNERLSAVIDLLKSAIGKRALGRPFRVYKRGPRGGWQKC
ncbi:hypothetical protein LCGC14_0660370 [marine sediment metagenome]|uniref:Uncharacterized protein n=1 Tax=marine sediment metagenome TaxID=412755 RepID=A0A0F9QYT4_9ZZZZ